MAWCAAHARPPRDAPAARRVPIGARATILPTARRRRPSNETAGAARDHSAAGRADRRAIRAKHHGRRAKHISARTPRETYKRTDAAQHRYTALHRAPPPSHVDDNNNILNDTNYKRKQKKKKIQKQLRYYYNITHRRLSYPAYRRIRSFLFSPPRR